MSGGNGQKVFFEKRFTNTLQRFGDALVKLLYLNKLQYINGS